MPVTDSQKLDFFFAMCPWGYMDVETAMEWLQAAGVDFADFGDYLENEMEETQAKISDVDLPYLALCCIVSQVNGAEELEVYGNSVCSTINTTEEDAAAILYGSGISSDDRGSCWEWLVEFTDAKQALKNRVEIQTREHCQKLLIEQLEETAESLENLSEEQLREEVRDAVTMGDLSWNDLEEEAS